MAGRNLSLLILLLCLPVFSLACSCGSHNATHHYVHHDMSPDEDDDTSPPDDDASPPDDDTSPPDDDASPPDDDDDSTPPLGACCDGGRCSVKPYEDCTGDWMGGGTICVPNPCVDDDDDEVSPDDDDDNDATPDDDASPPDDDTSPPDDDDDNDDDATVNVEYVDGGTFSDAAVIMTSGGQTSIVSGKSRELRVYTETGGGWPYEVAAFGVYANPSAALAPNGAIHVAYYDWFAQTLWHATNASGQWVADLVDNTGDVGHYSAIVVDANGAVHIAYDFEESRVPMSLRHAMNSGSGWQLETIASGSYLGAFPALAVDGAGVLYATYNNCGSGGCEPGAEIDIARGPGSGWTTAALPNSVPDLRASGLAAEANGTLHVVYHAADGGLYYAAGAWGSLTGVEIPGATTVADSLAMALDASNVVHVAYREGGSVMYGNNSGGNWSLDSPGAGFPVLLAAATTDDVAISVNTGNTDLGAYRKEGANWSQPYFDFGFTAVAPAMCADPAGGIHFVYLESPSTTLMHATNASGAWTYDMIANTIGSGAEHFGLVADNAGKLHVSYYSGLNFDLNYATNAGGSWTTGVIDGTQMVGSSSAITMDRNGALHVSYSDDGDGWLKYATDQSGSWQTVTVDNTAVVGGWSDIAVDNSGVVYIAYNDQSHAAVKVAKGNYSSFTTETVDSGGANYPSIVLDAQQLPQIAYVGAGLRHAGYDGHAWNIDVVDATALSSQTDIAAAAAGQFAIAYQGVGAKLRLAVGGAGAWSLFTIDQVDDVGENVSLAVTDNGQQFNLGYYGQLAVWLATARFLH
jgi:hypothetical protein